MLYNNFIILKKGLKMRKIVSSLALASIFVLVKYVPNPPKITHTYKEKAKLGEALKLPPWQERNRAQIEQLLQPISLEAVYQKYNIR